jgi:hypothetical protein
MSCLQRSSLDSSSCPFWLVEKRANASLAVPRTIDHGKWTREPKQLLKEEVLVTADFSSVLLLSSLLLTWRIVIWWFTHPRWHPPFDLYRPLLSTCATLSYCPIHEAILYERFTYISISSFFKLMLDSFTQTPVFLEVATWPSSSYYYW